MARLVDADALIKAFNEAQVEFDEYYKGLGKAKVITDNTPTVTPSEVQAIMKDYLVYRQEPQSPQGKWIDGYGGEYLCTNCLSHSEKITPFCSHCGADMRKG